MTRKETNGEKADEPGTNGPPDKRGGKTEAVKEAVAAGVTSPQKIVEYVREKHGLEVSPSYASGLKTEILRKKPGRKPRKEKPQQAAAEPPPEVLPAPHREEARGLTPQDL